MKRLFSLRLIVLALVLLIISQLCIPGFAHQSKNALMPAEDEYANFYHLGIDVSEYNGEIDWDAAAPYIEFAIIRVSDGGGARKHEDIYFDRNVQACERLGIPYGIYIYAEATTTAEALQEADYVLSRIRNYRPTLPIFYDVEEKKTILSDSMTNDAILQCVRAFCQTIEDAGFHAGVYSSTSPWNNRLTSKDYDQWCCWAAQYSDYCNVKAGAHLWQYSSHGSIPGIKSRVDMNYWFGQVGSNEHRFSGSKEEPTCVTDGSFTYCCQSCDLTVQTVIPALGHDYQSSVVEPTCTELGYTNHICSRCGQTFQDSEISALGHNWDEGKVQRHATASMDGVMLYMCLRCGETKQEPLPKLPPCEGGNSCPSAGYSDVPASSNWAHEGIDFCISNGLMGSTSTEKLIFSPKTDISRAMIVVILYRMEGSPTISYESVFTDVPAGKWFTDGILWAQKNNIVNGYGNENFKPNAVITREQLATVIQRYTAFK